MSIGPIIACFFTSTLLFLFSYLIWKKRDFTLIAGFNESTFKGDKNKLATAIGCFLLASGGLILILPISIKLAGLVAVQVLSVLIIVGLLLLLYYINKLSKAVN